MRGHAKPKSEKKQDGNSKNDVFKLISKVYRTAMTVNCQLSINYKISSSPQTSILYPASDKTLRYSILLKATPD